MYLVRERVPALTGVLTAASVAIVGVVIAGAVPSSLFPRAPPSVMAAIPHVLAGVSVVAVAVIAVGVLAVRRGKVDTHRTLMLTGVGLFGVFLAVDFYRLAVVGPAGFAGPAVVETYLYRPLLVVHSVLALLTFPAVYYALLLGLSYPVGVISETRHARIGRVAASVWLLTFVTGLSIYAMVHLVW